MTSHFPCAAQATWSLRTAGGSGKCILAGADEEKGNVDMVNTIAILILFTDEELRSDQGPRTNQCRSFSDSEPPTSLQTQSLMSEC